MPTTSSTSSPARDSPSQGSSCEYVLQLRHPRWRAQQTNRRIRATATTPIHNGGRTLAYGSTCCTARACTFASSIWGTCLDTCMLPPPTTRHIGQLANIKSFRAVMMLRSSMGSRPFRNGRLTSITPTVTCWALSRPACFCVSRTCHRLSFRGLTDANYLAAIV